MQEEDKEYLRKQNVDYYSDDVANKNIEKDVDKHSTKCAGDNLDKSAEFIFYGMKKRLRKKKKETELYESENHKFTAKTSLITKLFNLGYKQRCYKAILC